MKKNKLILFLVLLINILLRIPSLFDPVSYGDECIYLTLGQAFRKGLVFYRDIHDNKPPLLYLSAALVNGQLPYLRLLTIAWNSFNVWLIFKIAKKILKSEKAGILAAFLFSIFSLLPEGKIANGEIFMIMPATLAVFIALQALEKKKSYLWFLSGLMFSLAFLFKVPIAFDFGGFVLAMFIFSKKQLKNIFTIFKDKNFYLILIGFFLPILLSIVYYFLNGAFTPYVRSALLQNIGYLSSWKGNNSELYQRTIIVFGLTFLFFIWRKKFNFYFSLFSLMTLFGLYGVFLSERPYPHYLLEITPWISLLIPILIWQRKTNQLIVFSFLISLMIAGIIRFNFWWYPVLPYYQNFFKFVSKKINREEYFNYFGHKVINDYQIAYFLKKHSSKNDRIFIWGDGACIYALSRRLPVGRYTVNYHIFDFNGYSETIKAIKQQQPNIIIKLKDELTKFPQLDKILNTYYLKIKTTGNGEIFYRIFPILDIYDK